MKSINSPAKWFHIPYLNAIFQIASLLVSIIAVLVQRRQNEIISNWALAQNLSGLLASFFLFLTAFVLYKLLVDNGRSPKTGLFLVAFGFIGLVVGQLIMLLSFNQPALIFIWSSYIVIGLGLFLLGKIAKKTRIFLPGQAILFK
jgi:hypothetical protein